MTLVYLALAYAAGVYLGRQIWPDGAMLCDFPPWAWIVPLALLPLTALVKAPMWRLQTGDELRWLERYGFVRPGPKITLGLVLALLCCLAAGGLRYASKPVTPCLNNGDLAHYNLQAERMFDASAPTVVVKGYVASYVLVDDGRQRLQVAASTITRDGATQQVDGMLMANIGMQPRLVYGQPIRLRGRLATPPEFPDFSYREYLARRTIYSMMVGPEVEALSGPHRGSPVQRMLYAWRRRGEAVLNRAIPEPYAALANGILLGIDAQIPVGLEDAFTRTGTSHVLVISGTNVTQKG